MSGTAPNDQAPGPLVIGFEGWFLVRLTTDPDPTNDPRGVSGYTLAVAGEPDLDNWIRLNPPLDLVREPGRTLAQTGRMKVGVRVTSVTQPGRRVDGAEALMGAPVELLPSSRGVPMFMGRNDLVGSDDTIEFPIDPFIIGIGLPAGTEGPRLRREDVLPSPGPVWRLPPDVYAYRVGRAPADGSGSTANPSMEVMNAIGVYDFYEYFRDRSDWIDSRLRSPVLDAAAREAFETRKYAISFFGDRIRDRLGLQRVWDFAISRSTGQAVGLEGLDMEAAWPVTFWMGGFDGDLMMGYLRGSLTIPLRSP